MKLVGLCAFGTLLNKAFELHSLKVSIPWERREVSTFECKRAPEKGLQKALSTKLPCIAKMKIKNINEKDKIIYRN